MTDSSQQKIIWDKIFHDQEWGKYPSEDLIRFMAKYLYKSNGNRKNKKVLEIGSGPGANLWYLAREGFTIYGIDFPEKAVEISKSRLDSDIPNWSGKIIQGDITKLDFEDNYFDAIIDVQAGSCNDFSTAIKIYNEAYRVLKMMVLCIRTYHEDCLGNKTGKELSKNFWIPNEGPLEVPVRFSNSDDLGKFFSKFNRYEFEIISRNFILEEKL